ncbi:M3 family metallopeptidase [Sheuella amnicola]|uniref:M3 family metallopeptidase n=1 Tax=Sheuella amnicola TaxID=2707330 RepID=UPI0019409F66|nr:M3 family metallopeptidase [Sheuella amnicola]
MSLNDNPLLVPIEALINYAAVKPEHIAPAMTEMLERAKKAVEQAANPELPATWEAIVSPLDTVSEPLWRAWSVAGHLNSVVNTPELRDAYNAMLVPISEFSTWVGLHQGLYQQYQRLRANPDFDQWTPARKRVIELALRDFKLSGVELEGEARKRYAELSEQQSQVSQKFSENVLDSIDKWSLVLDDTKRLEGVPEDVIASLKVADAEQWKLTLKMPCYLPIMQYAQDRELRHTMYRAYATTASEQGDPDFDNSGLIEQSLSLRAEESQLLGFEHFAQLRLQTRMADSSEEVVGFLRQLAQRAKPFAEKDLKELRAFAESELGLKDLQPWDVAYVSEKLREARYAYSEDEVKQYLTEPRVMKGLFHVVQTLFGVTLEDCEVKGWHPDVRAAAVIGTSGEKLGYLMMDLYARPGKQGGAWVDSERTRKKHGDQVQSPIVYLTCNFARPQGDRPALWTHDDVITLFHESGHALHALLSEVDEAGASAFSAVEWDAIELPSQFMENFCWEWSVLQKLTAHVESGEHLPRDLFDRMTAARNFQSGMQTVRQIEFALFDILLHSRDQGLSIAEVLTQLDQVRDEVAVMRPPSWHRFPHSFSHLFAGGYGAGYYSYKWAEVLSSDAFEAFEEAAERSAESAHEAAEALGALDRETGLRFRKEILAIGGERPAADSFKAFRGRAPRMDALLRHSGMTDKQK